MDGQGLHATESNRSQGRRFDRVQYLIGNAQFHGIMHSIYVFVDIQHPVLICVVRRFQIWDPHPHDTLFVRELGHYRMRYAMKQSEILDCVVDVVLEHEVPRMEPKVRDQHNLVLRYGIRTTVDAVGDTQADRTHAQFSPLRGVEYTFSGNSCV